MDKSFTGVANASGVATVDITPVPAGRQWVAWQITVETQPVRSGVQAVLRRNGRYISSTIVGSGATASGPPAILLSPSDELTCVWNTLTLGDEAILTLFYEEVQFGQHGSGFGLV